MIPSPPEHPRHWRPTPGRTFRPRPPRRQPSHHLLIQSRKDERCGLWVLQRSRKSARWSEIRPPRWRRGRRSS
ncbi:hypothetical protein ACFX13_009988 [Malus domestica]